MINVVKLSDSLVEAIPIGRRTALGNPFALDRESQRSSVVEGYRRYLSLCALHGIDCTEAAERIAREMGLSIAPAWRRPTLPTFLAALKQLRLAAFKGVDLNLACSGNCAPKACHGDPLASYLRWCCANALSEERQEYGLATAIVGSRNYPNRKDLETAIKQCGWVIGKVLCGEAKGPDTWGKEWATSNDVPIDSHPAQWDVHGNRAGYLRNEEMLSRAQAAIALWDGKSNGTKHSIEIARRQGLRLFVVNLLDNEPKMSDNNEQMSLRL